MPRKKTTEEFILQAKEKHGDKYDYSRTQYINARGKVEIICKIHGSFFQNAASHLLGVGCAECAGVIKSSNQQFIEKARSIHGYTYDYSKVAYLNNRSIIKIICNEHGAFHQKAAVHLIGSGCKKCGINKTGAKNRGNTKNFIHNAIGIHGNKYDYSSVSYTTNTDKIKIICKEHGIFEQIPGNHLSVGAGCPKCGNRYGKWENSMIEKIKSWKKGIIILERYHPEWLDGMELDIFLPEYNLAIEYNGFRFHHSSQGEFIPPKPRNYHSQKFLLCKENGITLISIFDFLYNEKWDELIKHRLGCSNRIYARNTRIIEITDRAFYYDFCSKHHIEGLGPRLSRGSRIYGLEYEGEIIMLMSSGIYTAPGNKPTEKILRACTKTGYQVVGGVSKLYSLFPGVKFELTNNTGASRGNFIKGSERYWWVKNIDDYRTRIQCQKHRILKDFPNAIGTTENELMEGLGYVKVFDSGLSIL